MLDSVTWLEEPFEFAKGLPRLTRPIIQHYFRKQIAIEQKQDNSPVTEADRQVENILRQAIRQQFPDHGIIGEEYGHEKPDSPFQWVIDPIDGTKAFLCGLPLFTSLIALTYQGEPMLGLIDQPIMRETWLAAQGFGCFYNDKKLAPYHANVPPNLLPMLKNARMFCTTPEMFDEGEHKLFKNLAGQCGFVRYGCDAYAAGMMALGQGELMVEASLQFYDLAALVPIIEEIGGVVTDWQGLRPSLSHHKLNPRGRFIAAIHPHLHQAALSYLH